MTYLAFNPTAQTALQILDATQQALAQTQNEMASGLQIANAVDNPGYWSIAQTMQSDNGAFGAVASSLGQTSSMLSTTASAIKAAITAMNAIQTQLVAAQDPSADPSSILTKLQQSEAQLATIVSSASTNGVNLLDNSTTATGENFVSSYSHNGGATSTGFIHLATQSLISSGSTSGLLQNAQATTSATATDFTALTTSDISSANIATTLANATEAVSALVNYAAEIGSTQNVVTEQQTFIASMQTNLTNGVAALIDANMTQVKANLAAQQAQEQLAVQSLAISNQSGQLLLKLFQ